jgi:hypothetical protein
MGSFVNVKVSVNRDLLKRAKVIATKSQASVNVLLDAQLRYLLETFESVEQSGNENDTVLLDFSLGRITDEQAMRLLLIDSEEDLFLRMAQARLPMPRRPKKETNNMRAALRKLLP